MHTHHSDSVTATVYDALEGQQATLVICELYSAVLALGRNSWGLQEAALAMSHIRELEHARALAPGCAILPHVRFCARAFESSEYRRRLLPVGEVQGVDLRQFSQHAPCWGTHAVKRGSLRGWRPRWLSEKLEGAVEWRNACVSDSKGSVMAGGLDGVVFWWEMAGVPLDPLLMPVVGILIPAEARDVPPESTLEVCLEVCKITGEILCSVMLLWPGGSRTVHSCSASTRT